MVNSDKVWSTLYALYSSIMALFSKQKSTSTPNNAMLLL